METMENTMTKTNFTMTTDNFKEGINEFLTKLKRYADFMDYQVTGDINFDELKDLKGAIGNLSLSQKKKLRNNLISADHKMTLRTINRFLHFLYKAVLKSDVRVRVKPSVQDEEIQMKRKEWVTARDKAQVALFLYKKTKGDFYKDKEQKMKIAKCF